MFSRFTRFPCSLRSLQESSLPYRMANALDEDSAVLQSKMT